MALPCALKIYVKYSDNFFFTRTHCISITYKRIFISMTYKKSNKIK